jgi:hypothetical protein
MINKEIFLEVPSTTLEAWQDIVDILADIFLIPAALIMRINDVDIEVFVASKSKRNPYSPGDKEHLVGSGLYCERVITTQKKLLVANALADEDWKNNPDVKLNMISYLGFPIVMPDGKPFGTICVLDNKQNHFSETFEKLLLKFRKLIEFDIELLYLNQLLGDKNKNLTDYLMELQSLRGMVSICSNCKSIQDKQGNWHPVEKYLIRHPEADFTHGVCPECMQALYPGHFQGDDNSRQV